MFKPHSARKSGPENPFAEAGTERQLERLLSYYPLGELRAARRAEKGFVNENWIVETPQGRYLLKRRHPRLRRPDLIRAQHQLMQWLRRGGFPAPTIVPTITRQSFLVLDSEFYEVQEYIEGAPYDHDRTAHLEEAACTLGRYHTQVEGFAPHALRRPGELYSPAIMTSLLTNLIAAWHLRRDRHLADMARRLEAQVTDLSARFSEHGALPYRVIHGDYYADNLLFESDKIIGVVDYDKARWQPRIAELAEALIYFASPRPGHLKHLVYPGVLSWRPFFRFVRNYADAATLNESEIEALPHYIGAIWLSVSIRRLLEKGTRPDEAPEALQEVIGLAGWAKANAHQMVEAGHSAMLGA